MVIIKPLMQKYSPYTVTMWLFIFGFMFIMPFTIGSALEIKWAHLPMNAWLGIAFIIFGTTVLAYLINTYALRYLDAGVVGFYIYLQPLIATGIAILLGTEIPSVEIIPPLILIFLGVYLISRKNSIMPEWYRKQFRNLMSLRSFKE